MTTLNVYLNEFEAKALCHREAEALAQFKVENNQRMVDHITLTMDRIMDAFLNHRAYPIDSTECLFLSIDYSDAGDTVKTTMWLEYHDALKAVFNAYRKAQKALKEKSE